MRLAIKIDYFLHFGEGFLVIGLSDDGAKDIDIDVVLLNENI